MLLQQKQALLATVTEYIAAKKGADIGPILVSPSLEFPGIWVIVYGEWAYLGKSMDAAMLTAQLSDWWVHGRDGEMLPDDIDWFEERATLGENWEQKELKMFKEERRTRLTFNISLASNDEYEDDD